MVSSKHRPAKPRRVSWFGFGVSVGVVWLSVVVAMLAGVAPADAAPVSSGSLTVTSPAGSATISPTPTITGTAMPGTAVYLNRGVVPTQADGSGAFTTTVDSAEGLSNGTQTLTVVDLNCSLFDYNHASCPGTPLGTVNLTVTVTGGQSAAQVSRAQAAAAAAPQAAVVSGASQEASYICNKLQISGGGIRQIDPAVIGSPAYSPNKISPYFANYAVMGLAREAKTNSAVAACAWAAIEWYANHEQTTNTVINGVQNYQGFICDYRIANDGTVGPMHPADNSNLCLYDSMDSYAATFLMAVRDMYAATGAFPPASVLNGRTWDQVLSWPATLLHRLLTVSGTGNGVGYFNLTELALDGRIVTAYNGVPYTVAYSQDNAEDPNGLQAAYSLAAVLGDAAMQNQAAADKAYLKQGMQNHLWVAANHGYNLWTDPATGGTEPVSYTSAFGSGGAESNLFALALGATVGAPEGQATRNSTILNAFYAGAPNVPAQYKPTCWDSLPDWQKDMVCYDANLTILGVAASDGTDAKIALTNAQCAFSAATHQALGANCPAGTPGSGGVGAQPAATSVAVSGAAGENYLTYAAMYGVHWQTISLPQNPT
ncbi:MAG: hypothetical protein QOH56_2627 [Pseudonocardiales bacterium]|nr:hypothetical protein [Pseudonocardiales bacterium]